MWLSEHPSGDPLHRTLLTNTGSISMASRVEPSNFFVTIVGWLESGDLGYLGADGYPMVMLGGTVLPGRLHGSHSSQPILIRAGPGTGKLLGCSFPGRFGNRASLACLRTFPGIHGGIGTLYILYVRHGVQWHIECR